MIEAFSKLQEKPDVVFVHGQGITHPRLGLASHFSLVTGIPTIGVTNSLFDELKVEKDYLLKDGKKVGRALLSKEGSTPIFISPGNQIDLESSYEFSKKLLKSPHKLPEPMYLAHKYAKNVREELKI
jgi:deoxyribonuclease V